MPPHYLHLNLPEHVSRNVSSYLFASILSRWNPPSGAGEMATVTSVPVLLFKMRGMFYCHCQEQFAGFTGRIYIGDTGAFYFDNIGAEDVKLFLLKQQQIISFF